MASPIGFRQNKTFKSVPANTETIIDNRGAYLYIEVTNSTASEVDFIPNDFVENGHRGEGIPIPPNSTRVIPMSVYKFKATGVVTVVAYGM